MLSPCGRVVALEPETGKEVWHYDVPGSHVNPSTRGVEYWPRDATSPPMGDPVGCRWLLLAHHLSGKDGKQYVVIIATGGGYYDKKTGDSVIAFALSQKPEIS